VTPPLEPQDDNPTAGFDFSKILEANPQQLAVRFAFGAGVSVVASIVSTTAGPFWGGTFLAFPAILAAGLTLTEHDEGNEAALHIQRGALLGSLGMVAFALVAAFGFERLPLAVTLVAAIGAWSTTAVGVYLAVASWRRRHRGQCDHRLSASA